MMNQGRKQRKTGVSLVRFLYFIVITQAFAIIISYCLHFNNHLSLLPHDFSASGTALRSNDEGRSLTSTTRSETTTSDTRGVVGGEKGSNDVKSKELQDKEQRPSLVLAGLVLETSDIRQSTWDFLHEMSCLYQAPIHIVARKVTSEQLEQGHHCWCAPFWIDEQDSLYQNKQQKKNRQLHNVAEHQHWGNCTDCEPSSSTPPSSHLLPENRVQRLALLRDLQRDRIHELWFQENEMAERNLENSTTARSAHQTKDTLDAPTLRLDKDNSVIVLLDLDVWKLPNPAQIIQRAKTMHTYDVVCGAGHWLDHPVEMAKQQLHKFQSRRKRNTNNKPEYPLASLPERPEDLLFYYDNFAFVAWPDTYGFPDYKRLSHRYYYGEDTSIIPHPLKATKSKPDLFTQYDLMLYLQQEAAAHNSETYEHRQRDQVDDDTNDSIKSNHMNNQENNLFNLAPVRSCFGGLGLYRASAWFTPVCRYNLFEMIVKENTASKRNQSKSGSGSDMTYWPLWMQFKSGDYNLSTNIMRYASKKERFPCEHVVFHDCLYRVAFPQRYNENSVYHQPHIAVDPELVVHWRNSKDVSNKKIKK
ncbi:hypothetical protein ACA910_007168 [Epithemia clementina (nom. ined.)]